MSEWKKVKLRELATKITKGTTPSNIGESFCGNGIPFIRSELITQNKYISYDGLLYISNATHEKLKRSQLEANDILFSMAGVYLGKTAILRECDVPANTNQAVALIRLNPMLCNVDYIYYFLNQKSVVSYVNQISGQAAQPNINLQQIGSIPILIPSREKQDNIATILSRYDSLIENYRKQIKFLEEAAQRLYKEWFVDLHFPSHENTKIVDGVPEGWEKSNINNMLTFHRGYDLTHKDFIDGPYPVVGSTSIIGCHNKYKIEGPGIVTGRSGSLGVYQLIWENFWPHNTSLYISDFRGHEVFFIYCMLKTVDFTTLNSGGAIPSLNRNTLSNILVVEPPKDLQQDFSRKAIPLFKKQKTLQSQIRLLTEARDRLLPKLMSGEIAV